MTHDNLAASLAGHLRTSDRMVWLDLQLGPSGSVRPDVYTINKSFVRPTPTAYEVKVSKSDFRADVTTGKWQAYLKFASGVYFACKAGLFGKADVPEHCGLIVLHESGTWRVAKKPVLRPVTIPQDALLKLLIDGVSCEGRVWQQRIWDESKYLDKVKSKFGEIVAKTVRDRLAVENETAYQRTLAARVAENAKLEADRIREQAKTEVEPIVSSLRHVLGLPADAGFWAMRDAVQKIQSALRQHPAEQKWQLMTDHLRRSLDCYGYKEPPTPDTGKKEIA